MSDGGFEGIGDFNSENPWDRYIAHQAAKGNYPRSDLPKPTKVGNITDLQRENDNARETDRDDSSS